MAKDPRWQLASRLPYFVGAVERQEEAERVYPRLGQRLGQFGREHSAEKTRVMPCRRQPPAPTTSVALLGFEVRWDPDRAGQAQVTRRTARKTLRHARKRFTPGCREHRNRRLGIRLARRHAKRRGYYHDEGVPGHGAGLQPCCSQVLRILKTRLNRRSDNGAGDTTRLAPFTIDRPRIVGRPQTRLAASQVSAGWRTRVYLTRPVRENRTPGSVQGRSGNWPSYRDGAMAADQTVLFTMTSLHP